MIQAATEPPRPATDKRESILGAALRLIARLGLHNTPMSSVAREAGVAAGTLYLYFPSKEAMINALFLDLLEDQSRATPIEPAAHDEPRDALWHYWHRLARWYLDNPEASSVLHQCQSSAILTEETRAAQQRMEAAGVEQFDDAVARGFLRDLPRPVFYALLVGPIFVLAQLREKREIEITDEVLRMTYDGVSRSVLPSEAAG